MSYYCFHMFQCLSSCLLAHEGNFCFEAVKAGSLVLLKLLGTLLLRFSFCKRNSPWKGQSSDQIRAGKSVLVMMAPLERWGDVQRKPARSYLSCDLKDITLLKCLQQCFSKHSLPSTCVNRGGGGRGEGWRWWFLWVCARKFFIHVYRGGLSAR
jgi:hypothetical protein